MSSRLLPALWSFVCATLALWMLDVAVNLGVAERVLLDQPAPARLLDFFGLLIAETQIAFAVVLLVWLGAPVVARLTRSKDASGETLPLLGAALSGIAILAGLRFQWGVALTQLVEAVLAALVASVVLWGLFRFFARNAARRSPGLSSVAAWVFYPPLFVGLANLVIDDGVAGRSGPAAAIAGVIIVLSIGLLGVLRRRGPWRLVGSWLPFVIVLVLSAASVLGFRATFKRPELRSATFQPSTPNIVLIVLDTVRADHLKRYGYARDTMPILESWAERSWVFTRAVSPAGWTTPSHASIFSGKPVSLHGVHSSVSARQFFTHAYDDVEWLPRTLSVRGYTTLAVSANYIAIPHGGVGFDRVHDEARWGWWNSTIAGLCDDHVSPLLRGINERLRWRMPYVDASGITDIVTRVVPAGDGPIFLFVNYLDAHSPYNPPPHALQELGLEPPRVFGRYSDHRALTRMWDGLPESKHQCLRDLYDGELRGLDAELGRLLGWIDRRLGDDTVVIVTSDHGEELGEDGRVGHEYGLSQSLLHVPLFVRLPGAEPLEIDETINLRSVHDFIRAVGMGGRPTASILTAIDTFGVLSERYPSGSEIALSGPAYDRAWVSMIQDGYKVVGPAEHGIERFDVSVDFRDREVHSPEHTMADTLAARIADFWQTYRDSRDVSTEVLDEDALDRLRALGYIR